MIGAWSRQRSARAGTRVEAGSPSNRVAFWIAFLPRVYNSIRAADPAAAAPHRRTALDKFVEFNYLLLDASPAAPRVAAGPSPCRERVDVIARQFRDLLGRDHPADDRPRGMVMTHDFKVRCRATRAAGWLSFHVDRGDGTAEELEQVALVAFARAGGDEEVRRVLQRAAPDAATRPLPAAPFAVGVLLTGDVPPVVSEFLTKAAAGFFAEEL
jgi:hypothetical protein